MKSILDKDFTYTPSVSTNIMERFIANGLQPRKQPLTEIERLRRFKRQIEAHASCTDSWVHFDLDVFEEILADADGATNDH